jgi:hypothetical protein
MLPVNQRTTDQEASVEKQLENLLLNTERGLDFHAHNGRILLQAKNPVVNQFINNRKRHAVGPAMPDSQLIGISPDGDAS